MQTNLKEKTARKRLIFKMKKKLLSGQDYINSLPSPLQVADLERQPNTCLLLYLPKFATTLLLLASTPQQLHIG